MGKKRRERDRPKAAHDAPYNPNKRVLLSYESDDQDEDEDQDVGVIENPLLQRAANDYSIHAPEEVQDATAQIAGAEQDDEKQDLHGDEDVERIEGEDQPQSNDAGLWLRPTGRNIATGQWAALGSLSYQYDDEDEGEEYESEEEEAMAYLRAVRSERQAMPDFFVAQQTYSHAKLYNNGIGDTRGRFDDGAYIAAPISGPTLPESAKTHIEPQAAFSRALKERFLQQRQHLHAPPSASSRITMDNQLLTSLPKNDNQKYAQWLKSLRTVAPHPDQVRLIDQASIMRVLKLIQERFLVRERHVTSITSAWIWSLLARLDEVGTMDSDRIALLRDFGKRAILVQLSFRDPEAAAELERMADVENGAVPPKQSGQKVKTANQSAIEDGAELQSEGKSMDPSNAELEGSKSKRSNTLATLDTIIVLVGDVFGQRDLLEFRQPWEVEESESLEAQASTAANAEV